MKQSLDKGQRSSLFRKINCIGTRRKTSIKIKTSFHLTDAITVKNVDTIIIDSDVEPT